MSGSPHSSSTEAIGAIGSLSRLLLAGMRTTSPLIQTLYDRHDVRSPKAENMYSSDIDLLRGAICQRQGAPIVVQLSTYSVNGGNSQSDVFENVVPRFTEMDFSATAVRADNSMTSFVFSRGVIVPWDLEDRFRLWLADRRSAA